MSYKIEQIYNNIMIIDGGQMFSKGLLFPYNITFHDEEVSLPFALDIMNKLRVDESLLKNIKILSKFGTDSKYAMLTFDCEELIGSQVYDIRLTENTTYNAKILAKTQNSTVVSVNGYFGYIEGPIPQNLDDFVAVTLSKHNPNRFGFSQFYPANILNEEVANDEESDSIEDFLTPEELAAINDNERADIEWLLENIEGINRKNVCVVRDVLDLTFNPHTQSDITNFLQVNPHYFEENYFWVGTYKDKETNDVKLIIYDSNDVVMEVVCNGSGLFVTEFSHDRNKSNAQYLLNNNQNALVISGTNIIFHANSYLRDDYIELGEKILRQKLVAKDILPNLKKAVRTLKEKAGVEYLTLKEYLSYQENKEKSYNESHVVVVKPNEASIDTTEEGKTALFLSMEKNLSQLFTEQDEDVCYVELTVDEKKIKAELKGNADKGGYCIMFYNEHQDIDSYRKNGFELRRRASVNHLKLQKNAINDFVYGEGEESIFEKLNLGQLDSPTPDDSIKFFDNKFDNVEEGNNQPLAIRKAVNNNDIFLIQGPPGTGKTSVIVEIVKQLVINRGEKVLVCSQAHSAVKNIYDRLINTDERLRIGNIDEKSTMIPDDIKEHPDYLRENMLLLSELSKGDSSEELWTNEKDKLHYSSKSKDIFMKRHEYVCNYYEQNAPENTMDWIDMLSELRKGIIDLGDDARAFNNARHYQGLNVVMGTCIGIGMDPGLRHSGIKFDTVIIDEAGKANLAETTVPMKLGKKYILVGDNKQLPPYMDVKDITNFINETNLNLSKEEVEGAISSSLFEDFIEDTNFPKESSVMLNYQYRMNPEIGDYISELFYETSLKNGKGTEKQQCNLNTFPNAVTFMDTTGAKDSYEKSAEGNTGYYNPEEINVFKESLLPRLLEVVNENHELSVGIITPYRQQRERLQHAVRNTILSNSVYTIDSIQGSEFDIVVISLVRSFKPNGYNNVGFLDDMRRLNVALSRAKKKLIVIGNLGTLCNPKAHSEDLNQTLNPVSVFQKLRLIHDRTAEKTSLEILKDEISAGHIKAGTIFDNCTWFKKKSDYRKIFVKIALNGQYHTFPIQENEKFKFYGYSRQTVDIRFIGINDKGWAMFEYIPDVSVVQMIEDKVITHVIAKCGGWTNDDKNEMNLVFADESDADFTISGIHPRHFFWDLLDSNTVGYMPLFIREGAVFLDINPYKNFNNEHKSGDIMNAVVVDNDPHHSYYIVKCGDVFGKIYHKGKRLNLNEKVKVSIYKIDANHQSIIFNLI